MSSTSIKSFTSSVVATEASAPAGPDVTVEIDGRPVTFSAPDMNQTVIMALLIENATSDREAAISLINIFFSMIAPDERPVDPDGEEVDEDDPTGMLDYTKRWLEQKMMKPARIDPFGLETIAAVMGHLLEEWSARPTQRSGASSSSPPRAGTTSRAKQRGGQSTRGRSR